MAGSFMTKHDCLINFTLPELNPTASIRYMVHVTKHISKYDMIIGRDILQELGIILDFEECQIKWKNYFTPMKESERVNVSNYAAENIHAVQAETERIQRILDAKYEPASLLEITSQNVVTSIRCKLYGGKQKFGRNMVYHFNYKLRKKIFFLLLILFSVSVYYILSDIFIS